MFHEQFSVRHGCTGSFLLFQNLIRMSRSFEQYRTFYECDFYRLNILVGTEIELCTQYLHMDVTGRNDKSLVRVLCHIGKELSTDKDFSLSSVKSEG